MKTRINPHPATKLNIVELPNDILNTLATKAEQLGVTVKRLMENLIINSIDSLPLDHDDEVFYSYMVEE